MAQAVINSCVYCNFKYCDVDLDRVPVDIPAPERIGDIWARVRASDPSRPEFISLLTKLGVDPTDGEAHRELIPVMREALKGDVSIKPSTESGVYFLKSHGKKKPFGVFKVGEKRARIETAVRHMAHQLGCERNAVPGVFCSIANPTLSGEERIVAELHNGNTKEIVEAGETVTGILEPYYSPNKEISVSEFADMTAFILAIGGRDMKLDGMSGSRVYDTEDCMPERLLPSRSPDRHVAATHLPYLVHPHAETKIPSEALCQLAGKVERWVENLDPFLVQLAREQVHYADLPSESLISVEDFIDVATKFQQTAKENGKEITALDEEEFTAMAALLKSTWDSGKGNNATLDLTIEKIRDLRKQENFPKMMQLASCSWGEEEIEELAPLLGSATQGRDHGGCLVEIARTQSILEKHPTVNLRETERLFSDAQLAACRARVRNLARFLTDSYKQLDRPATTLDMVGAVDPLYKKHMDALKKSGFDRTHPAYVVGQVSPKGLGSFLSVPSLIGRVPASD